MVWRVEFKDGEESQHMGLFGTKRAAQEFCTLETEVDEKLMWIKISKNLVLGCFEDGLDDNGKPIKDYNHYVLIKEEIIK